MGTLADIAVKINSLKGDLSFRSILSKNLDYLDSGRRAGYEFLVKTNMRTLRSGPNRGKIRVDGALVIMLDKKSKKVVRTAIVRYARRLLPTLDSMARSLQAEI